ncbi:MAG: DUF86 domain-containing protein [Gammaproteobacteria bacterium]|nr:DUF86 domain-containing protein [Gammaproteobacteria bacterium]
MMENKVNAKKIETLSSYLMRVEQRCPPDLDELLSDLDAQDVLTLNLSRAIQLCVDISLHILSSNNQTVPQTMADAFTGLVKEGIISVDTEEKMRKAVGFRNIAIHEYEKINWAIVYAIATERMVDFRVFAKTISELLND